MESKKAILDSIRKRLPPERPLPDLDQRWIAYDDRTAHFGSMVESVGGRFVLVDGISAIDPRLQELDAYREAKRIVTLVEGVGRNTVELGAIDDPHALEDLDFAILLGQFAVAENGAVWVTDAGLKHRAVPFIVQHLALVVPASQIVDNMHQAYERLSFTERGFGAFISGPSKTADIEQSLVIGAHGPRSLTVFCWR
jgi:L-lactate dehydrogenase complex protein LldG